MLIVILIGKDKIFFLVIFIFGFCRNKNIIYLYLLNDLWKFMYCLRRVSIFWGFLFFWEIRCIKWVDYKWVVLSIVVDILVSIWELKGYLYLRFNVIFFK